MTYETKQKSTEALNRRLSARRLTWPSGELTFMSYTLAKDSDYNKILTWIDRHTSGKFYVGGSHIAFADDADAVMFKLGWKP